MFCSVAIGPGPYPIHGMVVGYRGFHRKSKTNDPTNAMRRSITNLPGVIAWSTCSVTLPAMVVPKSLQVDRSSAGGHQVGRELACRRKSAGQTKDIEAGSCTPLFPSISQGQRPIYKLGTRDLISTIRNQTKAVRSWLLQQDRSQKIKSLHWVACVSNRFRCTSIPP
jgi:hypothetical protein